MQSWMFLSSFETLRKKILATQHIDSLLHLGPRTFDELSGEVVQNAAFVISKTVSQSVEGIYYRLIDGKNCAAKRDMYLANEKRYIVNNQSQFNYIPGAPTAYWVSDRMFDIYNESTLIKDVANPCKGIDTGDNDYFLRSWFEINHKEIDPENGIGKWVPYNKGGGYRKWYGNRDNVLLWGGDDRLFRERLSWKSKKPTLRNKVFWFRESGTWSTISTSNYSIRFSPKGAMYDSGGNSIFSEHNLRYLIGYLNTKIASKCFDYLAPTINYQPGDVGNQPIIILDNDISMQVQNCIDISKQDWDAHETSWDFQCNELAALSEEEGISNIEVAVEAYERKWTDLFFRLHANEEELNRQFIEIYGLQDELTPDVPLEEVTILQQGEISIAKGDASNKEKGISNKAGESDITSYLLPVTYNSSIVWNHDVIIKQLVSYMVGVWMGRYRLDCPGLNVAHPDPTEEEMASYQYGPDNATLVIDDDAIIPILPTGAPFEDNLTEYIANFVRIAWGEESQTDNLNFIEQCLGKKIEDYVQKDFWKDHKKMYQNRPIYWLFSSKKGAFKALVYVHRMHPYTVEQVRTRYLLKYMDWLRSEAQRLEIRDADLTTAERRRLDRLRSDIEECEEYHERLQVVAEQAILIDLDNGIPANHAIFGDILTKLK